MISLGFRIWSGFFVCGYCFVCVGGVLFCFGFGGWGFFVCFCFIFISNFVFMAEALKLFWACNTFLLILHLHP